MRALDESSQTGRCCDDGLVGVLWEVLAHRIASLDII